MTYVRTIIESERAKRTHCCTLIEIFVYIFVTKILRKIRVTTFTEKLRKITLEGGALGMSNAAFPISLGSATLYPFATH